MQHSLPFDKSNEKWAGPNRIKSQNITVNQIQGESLKNVVKMYL